MSPMQKGTPKNLQQAISNGIHDWYLSTDVLTTPAILTEKHVRDFIAQKFTTETMKSDVDENTQLVLKSLYFSITGKHYGEK